MSLDDPDAEDEDDAAQTDAPWHRDIWGDLDARFLGDGSGNAGHGDLNNADADDGEETEDEA